MGLVHQLLNGITVPYALQDPRVTVEDALIMALATALVMPFARNGRASADFGDLVRLFPGSSYFPVPENLRLSWQDWSLPVHNIRKRGDAYHWIPELLNGIFDSGRTVRAAGRYSAVLPNLRSCLFSGPMYSRFYSTDFLFYCPIEFTVASILACW